MFEYLNVKTGSKLKQAYSNYLYIFNYARSYSQLNCFLKCKALEISENMSQKI